MPAQAFAGIIRAAPSGAFCVFGAGRIFRRQVMLMRQLTSRILLLAAVLAAVLILTLVINRSVENAQAAETASKIEAVKVETAKKADSPQHPIDPAMHAFFVDYLTTKWKLPAGDAMQLATWVLIYSAHYQTDPMVQLARVLRESRGRHYRSTTRRDKSTVVRGGAREIGFSQIMPFWAGKRVEDITITREMLYEPEGNIRAGIALYKRYEHGAGSYLLALARYNRPGSRRPNSYARHVDSLYQEIKRKYVEFKARQPGDYRLEYASLAGESGLGDDFTPNIYF